MRVRLKEAVSIPANDQARFAAWIEPGKEYVVLEICGPWLRLHDEPVPSFTHGLWEARYFHVTHTALPRNWTIDLDAEGRVQLAPIRWLEEDFWSALHDDELVESLTWEQRSRRHNDARAIYEEELRLILADSV